MNDKNKTTNNPDVIWSNQTLNNIYESVQHYDGKHKREAFDELRTIYSDLMDREVDRLIKKIYQEFEGVSNDGLTSVYGIKDLIDVVCGYYVTTPDKLVIRSRKRVIVEPKQLIHWMLKNKVVRNSLTLEHIGKFTGNQDHATVLHGSRNIHNRIKNEHRFREDVMSLCNKLGARTFWNGNRLEISHEI